MLHEIGGIRELLDLLHDGAADNRYVCKAPHRAHLFRSRHSESDRNGQITFENRNRRFRLQRAESSAFHCGGLFLVEDDAYALNVAEQVRIRNVCKDRQIDFVGQ